MVVQGSHAGHWPKLLRKSGPDAIEQNTKRLSGATPGKTQSSSFPSDLAHIHFAARPLHADGCLDKGKRAAPVPGMPRTNA